MSRVTKVLKSDGTGLGPEVGQAAEILDAGGLVAFPTDTVYALASACRLDEGQQRLADVKKRGADKPFVVLLADPSDVEDYVDAVPEFARALITAFWPGPLTLVLPKRNDAVNSVGLRLPDHPLARAIVRQTRHGVVATSANMSGGKDATTAQEVLALFGGEIELVIDGGPPMRGRASTVVSVTSQGWRILREGEITSSQIAATGEACGISAL